MDADGQLVTYRVVQESLSKVARHAQASTVLKQMLVGVSTRRFARTREPVGPGARSGLVPCRIAPHGMGFADCAAA